MERNPRRLKLLGGLLLAAMLLFLGTLPMRFRITRQTAQLQEKTKQTETAIRQMEKLDTAIAAAKKRVQQDSESYPARMELAAALGQARHYPEEILELRTAAQLKPRSAQPHIALARVLGVLGGEDLAVEELRRAMSLEPQNVEAIQALAYRYITFGWNRDAQQLVAPAVSAHPKDVSLRITYGLTYFQNSGFGAAERQLMIARRLSGDAPAVMGPLIDLYSNTQRYQDVIRTADEIYPRFPDKLSLLLEKAQAYLGLHQPDLAERCTNEALKLSPTDTQTLYTRALARKEQGKTAEAIQDLEAVRKVDPRTQQTLLLLGQLYMRAGQPAKARQYIAEFRRNDAVASQLARLSLQVEYRPRDSSTHLQMGEYYLRGGSKARAIVELKRALELKPDSLAARQWLIRALRAAGRTDEAAGLETGAPYRPEVTLAPTAGS